MSQSPYRVQLTVTYTLTGSATASGDCGGITHTANVKVYIGGRYFTVNQQGSVTTFFNIPASITLDSQYDPCLLGGGCKDTSTETIHCSFINADIFKWLKLLDWEVAFTLGTWTGGPGQNCRYDSLLHASWCNFPVMNWCMTGTTPPDNNLDAQTIYDITPPGPYHYYPVSATCISFNLDAYGNGHQPWHCENGWTTKTVGTNASMAPAACSCHP